MANDAFSAREAERRFGIGRGRLAQAIAAGELMASRLGTRRLVILRGDLERWLARYAVQPDEQKAMAAVTRRLEADAERASP